MNPNGKPMARQRPSRSAGILPAIEAQARSARFLSLTAALRAKIDDGRQGCLRYALAFAVFVLPLVSPAAHETPAPANTSAIDLLGGPPPSGAAAPPPAENTDPAAPLARLVGELSARDTLLAADYATMARATIRYGEAIQASRQPVPAPPVHDALAAVDAGVLLDKNAADWPRLRERLEALLKKTDEQRQQNQDDQQKQDQQKDGQKQDGQQQQQNQSGGNNSQDRQNQSGGQNSDSQKQDSQGGGQSQDQQQQQQNRSDQSDRTGQSQQKSGQDQQQQQSGKDGRDGQKDRRQQNGEKQDQPSPADRQPQNQQSQSENRPEPRQGEKAFDDMQKKEEQKDAAAQPKPEAGGQPQPQPAASGTAPAAPGDTQQVGGSTGDQTAKAVDPALVVPLQMLDQIRNQDSPAYLHQLMQDPNQPVKKGKDW